MNQETLYYPPRLFEKWKKRAKHRKWLIARYKNLYCKRDRHNIANQPSYHFGEWFTACYFLRQGYEVLMHKYLHPTRPDKRRTAAKILGNRGVEFLMRRRKLGGSKLRKSPRPDLLVFRPNRKDFFFVEVKRMTDRLSLAQSRFFPMIERRFGRQVIVVRLKEGEKPRS
jgi:hypothetical protein